ncbi:M43 family zinc metalloprotease [Lewinella sp. 4G2]|uniref:M43 family zinc metalloprotease n=1 Tax=Lewinella sp. 4G2 TaxID=1803372 RepID=UPI0007B4E9F5|nr:M43 family zinc metalloprotease [Lewinella sp. 4G2]OAV43546.1 hypothetical protein A3850_003120 [Lewinella sp. 4G2]
MRHLLFLTVIPLLLLTCRTAREASPRAYAQDTETITDGEVTYFRFRPDSVQRPDTFVWERLTQQDRAYYLPDPDHPEYLPERRVRLNFHVMNSADSIFPMQGEVAVKYAQDVLNYTNAFMRDNPENWLNPDSITPPALPTHIKYVLATDPETQAPAVYEHFDDEHYGYIHKGPGMNRSDMEVVKKYNVRPDEELNIYWMGPPKEKIVNMGAKKTSGSGIYLGTALKVTDVLSKDVAPWSIRQVFSHELGHALGLYHAWTRNDGCPDTPVHANKAWSAKKRGPNLTSNNLMDYSPDQEALTPCQIARMHIKLADKTTRQRGWLEPVWCDYEPDAPIIIAEDLVLNGARDYASDLIVQPGATLTINNRVHLPEGGSIRVAAGGRLILGPDAILHNDCGGTWRGIFIAEATSIEGLATVETHSSATLLNVAP